MTAQDYEGLLPCPFCGGSARYGTVTDECYEKTPDFGGSFVMCNDCNACTELVYPLKDDVRRELAERWNRRADALHTQRLEIARLTREADQLTIEINEVSDERHALITELAERTRERDEARAALRTLVAKIDLIEASPSIVPMVWDTTAQR